MTAQTEQRLRKLRMDIQTVSARGTSDRSMQELSRDLQNMLVEGRRVLQGISPQEDRQEYTDTQNLINTVQRVYTSIAQEVTKVQAQLRALYQAL